MYNPFEELNNRLISIEEKLDVLIKRNAIIDEHSSLKEVMNIAEMKDFLKISKSTLYNLISNGNFPYAKVGRRYIFHRTQVMKWIEENSYKSDYQLKQEGLYSEVRKRYR